MRISLPVKDIVLTSIANRGVKETRSRAQSIADDCFATKGAVLNWIRKFEKGEVKIA